MIGPVDEPRVRGLAKEQQLPYYPLDSLKEPDLVGFFEVFTAPAVLVYHKRKEIARQARFIDFRQLEKLLGQLPRTQLPENYETLF